MRPSEQNQPPGSLAPTDAAASPIRAKARAHAPLLAVGAAALFAGAAATGAATASAAGVSPASAPISTTSTGEAGSAMAGAIASGRSYTPPPTAQANTAGQPLQNGLQTPSFAGREQDFQNETFEAQYRAQTDPVSAEQATAALQSLPQSTQRAVGQLVSDHGEGAREHLAYQARCQPGSRPRSARSAAAAGSAGSPPLGWSPYAGAWCQKHPCSRWPAPAPRRLDGPAPRAAARARRRPQEPRSHAPATASEPSRCPAARPRSPRATPPVGVGVGVTRCHRVRRRRRSAVSPRGRPFGAHQ